MVLPIVVARVRNNLCSKNATKLNISRVEKDKNGLTANRPKNMTPNNAISAAIADMLPKIPTIMMRTPSVIIKRIS